MAWIIIIAIILLLFALLRKKDHPKTLNSKLSPDRNNLHDVLTVIAKEKQLEQSDYTLDPSSALIIELPQLSKPDFNEDRKPQEYWNIFFKGLDYYNRASYLNAKDELLKLRGYKEPHTTYLLIC